MEVGRSIPRVDAADKVTGRAKYTDDLCPRPVLEAEPLPTHDPVCICHTESGLPVP